VPGQEITPRARPAAPGADELPAAGVARVGGEHGTPGGAGCLVTADLVLTCAHVVSDALDRPREDTVAAGTTVRVGFPLATAGDRGAEVPAEVLHWVPIRPDRSGDLAVLRLREPAPQGARPLPVTWVRDVWHHRARAVGFTGGEPGGIWFRGRLGGRTGEGWLQLSRADGQTTHVREGFSGGPVWDEELDAVIGLVVAAQTGQDGQAFVLHTGTIARELPDLVPFLDPPSPFRGLVTYEEDDEDVFFGRAGDIEDVLTALSGTAAPVTLYGPSGCGKSSLARAGVLPRMRRDGYEVLVVDAGKVASPRAALAVELWRAVREDRPGPQRAAGVDEVERMLAAYGLTDTLHRLRGRQSDRLLVLLDQAEALLDRTEQEVAQLVELLFAQRTGPGPRALLTLRADFMDAVLRHPLLGPALRGGRTLPLTPMSRAQLEEVVTRPVARIPSVEYDPGLVRRILDDAGSEPGVLPLLGFVLQTLWERRSGGRLPTTAYEEMGGVLGALRRHADRVWAECVGGPGADECEARALLTGLVRVLPGSETPLRRRLTRREAGEVRWELARRFAERRLLVLHGQEGEPESAELAHEALITVWDRLRERIAEDGQFLAARAELAHDLDRWVRGERSPDLLPGPVQLGALEARLAHREDQLDAEERDFLARARRRRRAARTRARMAWTAVALVLALLVGLGTFLVYQSHISEQLDAQARSRALATLSDEQAGRDPGLASLTAVAAYDVSPTHEARNALLRRYAALKEYGWILSGAEGTLRAVATSGDASVTLVTTERGRATLFVRRPSGTVVRTHLRLAVNAVAPLVSRDGRRIAYLSAHRNHVSWHEVDPAAREVLGPRRTVRAEGYRQPGRASDTEGSPAGLAAFSPDARRVAAVSDDGRLWLWDLDSGRSRRLPAPAQPARGVAFGPDAGTLVTQLQGPGAPDTQVTVAAVDARTGRARTLAREVALSDEVARIALSGDGRVLAYCRAASNGDPVVYRAVRVTDGRETMRYRPGSSFLCGDLAVDRTGGRVAVHDSGARWTLLAPGRDAKPVRATGPIIGRTTGLPLLGTRDKPVALVWDAIAVTARPMSTSSFSISSPPVLLGDGDLMLVHQGERGEHVALVHVGKAATGGRISTVRRVDREPAAAPLTGPLPRMQVNRSETLMADLVDGRKVVIRQLPSLRRVAEVTLAAPPPGAATDPPYFGFLGDEELLTVSGGLIEQWNARNGLRLERTIDVRRIGLTDRPSPGLFVRGHPEPGHLLVHVPGRPTVHAVDRRTGRENKALRLRFGDDFVSGGFTEDGRHALVATMGGLLEGWSVSGGTARRVLGPLGPAVRSDQSQLRPVGRSAFVVASGTAVRFLHFDDLDRIDAYDFLEEQTFHAISPDGLTVLRGTASGMEVFRLDPALWKRHLCAVVGRDLSEDERRGLHWEVGRVCPRKT